MRRGCCAPRERRAWTRVRADARGGGGTLGRWPFGPGRGLDTGAPRASGRPWRPQQRPHLSDAVDGGITAGLGGRRRRRRAPTGKRRGLPGDAGNEARDRAALAEARSQLFRRAAATGMPCSWAASWRTTLRAQAVHRSRSVSVPRPRGVYHVDAPRHGADRHRRGRGSRRRAAAAGRRERAIARVGSGRGGLPRGGGGSVRSHAPPAPRARVSAPRDSPWPPAAFDGESKDEPSFDRECKAEGRNDRESCDRESETKTALEGDALLASETQIAGLILPPPTVAALGGAAFLSRLTRLLGARHAADLRRRGDGAFDGDRPLPVLQATLVRLLRRSQPSAR